MSQKYVPDQKCATCRNLITVTVGDGFHEPRYVEPECGVEDQLIRLESLMREIADAHGDEDAYGDSPADEMGETKPCPFYLEWAKCERHGIHEPPEGICSLCEEDAVVQLMDDERHAEEYWKGKP